MVATFILTRAFAISALFVGAFPLAHAAPVPNPVPSLLDTVPLFAAHERNALPTGLVPQAAEFPQEDDYLQRSYRAVDVVRCETLADGEEKRGCLRRRAAAPEPEPVTAPVEAFTSEDEDVEERACRPESCLRRRAQSVPAGALVDGLARRVEPEAALVVAAGVADAVEPVSAVEIEA
ncbi:hypothetical protein C2E23DRAFT_556093 [Lenzites betulinus]|nr:hypothetical protein C2E23DRAFT_556093 [Lenzites betulinus]